MRLNGSRALLDQYVRELEGYPTDAAKALEQRLEAARAAKGRRPFYMVTPLDRKQNTVAANETIELATDRVGFRLLLESLTTDQTQSSALFNFARYRGTERKTAFAHAMRANYFAGDSGADANRTAPQDAFYPPAPVVLEENESLSILVSGDPNTLSTNLVNTYLNYQGLRVYPKTSIEAQLTSYEQDEITAQIQNSKQEFRTARCYIDYSSSALSTNIPFDTLNEWAILLGFSTTLRWSLVKVLDPREHIWTNNANGIPSLALASYPFYTDGTSFEQFKMWPYSYLIAPNQPLRLSCAKRPTTGGFTNAITENNTGEFIAYFLTV